MSLAEIKNYLIRQGLLRNPVISLLGKGESNLNYLAEEDGHKYVVRITRSDVPSRARFETEHHFMLFMEALGITFAPVQYVTTSGITFT